uniref:U3 small nucleolar RNA-associated protein 15 homolog n=1 Tax=Ditylenchus dipsaci TaxID=166011 RepID=A0A915EHS7_9BILA
MTTQLKFGYACKPSQHPTSSSHGARAPVEKILVFPNDTIVVSAGGNKIKLWDMSAGGKLLHSIESHYKTITSMCFASKKTCLLTGGLDLVESSSSYLTLSMSENDQYMVYGMSNLLSIHERRPEEEVLNGVPTVDGPYCETPLFQRERGVEEAVAVDLTARQLDKMNLGALDHLLRLKRYRELVSTMMAKELPNTHPEMVVSAFQQLRIRQKLHLALSGHSEEELLPLINFLRLNLFKSTFFDVLYEVVNVFFTIYAEESISIRVVQSFKALQNEIAHEIQLQKQICKVLGTLNLFSKATTSRQITSNLPQVVDFSKVKLVPEVVWSLKKT